MLAGDTKISLVLEVTCSGTLWYGLCRGSLRRRPSILSRHKSMNTITITKKEYERLSENKKIENLSEARSFAFPKKAGFVGMWKNRKDIAESTSWVRKIKDKRRGGQKKQKLLTIWRRVFVSVQCSVKEVQVIEPAMVETSPTGQPYRLRPGNSGDDVLAVDS
jgi:hypothetical protein